MDIRPGFVCLPVLQKETGMETSDTNAPKLVPTEGRPLPERRGGDRRSGDRRLDDRRCGDRRQSERRRTDRRNAGEQSPWRFHLSNVMTRRMSVALILLLGATLVLVLTSDRYIWFGAGADEPMIVVEAPGVGMWVASPRLLAQHFATQEVMASLGRGPTAPEILTEKIELITNNLLQRPEALLERVRAMAWRDFVSKARFEAHHVAPVELTPEQQNRLLRDAVWKKF